MNGERSISLIGTGPVGGRGTEEEEPSLNTDTAVEWSAKKRLCLSVMHMEIEEGGCQPTHTFFWSCQGILQCPRVEELLPGLLCLQSEWIICASCLPPFFQLTFLLLPGCSASHACTMLLSSSALSVSLCTSNPSLSYREEPATQHSVSHVH